MAMVAKAKPADPRYGLLDAAMKRQQYRADALLEVLHSAQEIFGSLSPELLRYVARGLKQPLSRVFGVATFYHFFTFTPKGAHSCVLCLGTACYVKGAGQVQETLEKTLGIPAGQTRSDGAASLQMARCLGACGIAPAGVFDGNVVGHLTRDKAITLVQPWLK